LYVFAFYFCICYIRYKFWIFSIEDQLSNRKGRSMSQQWDPPPGPPKTPGQIEENWEWYNVLTKEGGASGAAKGAVTLAGGASVIAAGTAIAAGVAVAPVVVPVAIIAGAFGAITGGIRKRSRY
jgi:hypothetical protein